MIFQIIFIADKTTIFSGLVTVTSKNSEHKVSIPYRARVLRGNLELNHRTKFSFFNGAKSTNDHETDNVTIKNTFNQPVAVIGLNVSKHLSGIIAVKESSFHFRNFISVYLIFFDFRPVSCKNG